MIFVDDICRRSSVFTSSRRARCQRTADGAADAGSDVGRQTEGKRKEGGTGERRDFLSASHSLGLWTRVRRPRPPGARPAVHPSIRLFVRPSVRGGRGIKVDGFCTFVTLRDILVSSCLRAALRRRRRRRVAERTTAVQFFPQSSKKSGLAPQCLPSC